MQPTRGLLAAKGYLGALTGRRALPPLDWEDPIAAWPRILPGEVQGRALKCMPRAGRGPELSWDPSTSITYVDFSDHHLPFCKNGKLRPRRGRSLRVPPSNFKGSRAARDPQLPHAGFGRCKAVGGGTSRLKVRGRCGGNELKRSRSLGSAHSARSQHYLIAAHAHWLAPPEAGPMRRSC